MPVCAFNEPEDPVPNIGPLEIAIILVIVLVVFGPKRLPDLGRSLGQGMNEFKSSLSVSSGDDEATERPTEKER